MYRIEDLQRQSKEHKRPSAIRFATGVIGTVSALGAAGVMASLGAMSYLMYVNIFGPFKPLLEGDDSADSSSSPLQQRLCESGEEELFSVQGLRIQKEPVRNAEGLP